MAWQRAQELFNRERYFRAHETLKDITLNYSGSTFVDSVQFLLARASYEMGDYLVAADEFHRLSSQYAFSKLVGDAAYWESRCFFSQAPSYQLDQDYTSRALDGFQRFLEDYPGHSLTDSAYSYLSQSREKLARKQYAAAELYFRLSEYASTILYSDLILANYYDSSYASKAHFLKARAFYKLKDWSSAQVALTAYLKTEPKGRSASHARRMLESVDRQLVTSASNPSIAK